MGDWPSDVGYAIVTGRLARVVADSTDSDTIPDFHAATGRVVLEPDLREVRYIGEMGYMMLSLDTVECTIDDMGNVLGPDGESIVCILASDSPKIEQTGWTWSVRFELDDGTWRDVSHVLARAGERIDLASLARVSASAGVENVVDTVTADRANAAADRANAAADRVDAATAAASGAAMEAGDAATRATSATEAAAKATGDATTAAKAATDAAQRAATAAENCDATASGADATTTTHGLMSAADKAKLDGLPRLTYDARPTGGSANLLTSGSVADALGALPLDVRGMHVHRFGLGNQNTNDNRGASWPSVVTRLVGCYIEELMLLVISELETRGTLDVAGGQSFGQQLRLPSYVPRPPRGAEVPLGQMVVWDSSNHFITWNRLVYQTDGICRITFVVEGKRQTAFAPMVAPLRAYVTDDSRIDPAQPRGRQLIGASMAGEVLG